MVHDDASPDGTDDVLHEYENEYPDKIIAMYEEVWAIMIIREMLLTMATYKLYGDLV